MQEQDASDTGELGLQFKWSDELTKKFIILRQERRSCFTGRRNSARTSWEHILGDLGLEGLVTALQCRKKWSNLVQHYKEIKREQSEGDPGDSVWPFYDLMCDVLGDVKVNLLTKSSDNRNSGSSPIRAIRSVRTKRIQPSSDISANSTAEDSDSYQDEPTGRSKTRQTNNNKKPRLATQMQHAEESPETSTNIEEALLQQLVESNRLLNRLHQSFTRQNDVLHDDIQSLIKAINNSPN